MLLFLSLGVLSKHDGTKGEDKKLHVPISSHKMNGKEASKIDMTRIYTMKTQKVQSKKSFYLGNCVSKEIFESSF